MSGIIFSAIFYFSFLAFPLLLILIYKAVKSRRWHYYLAVIFVLLFIYARFIETSLIRIDQESFDLNNNSQELKIAVAADIHLGIFKSQHSLKRIVKKINVQEPDLVLIPGDLVFYLPVDKFREFEELKNIKAPVVMVLGNHDNGQPKGHDVSLELKEYFAQIGLTVLDNQIWEKEINGQNIKIVGLSDYYNNNADFSLLKKDNGNQLLISLTHNPDLSYQYPEGLGVDLTVSGHTHGGQVRVPGLYRSMIPSDYGFNAGYYEVNGYKVFISSGLGQVGLPFRFLRLPEINVLNIK